MQQLRGQLRQWQWVYLHLICGFGGFQLETSADNMGSLIDSCWRHHIQKVSKQPTENAE